MLQIFLNLDTVDLNMLKFYDRENLNDGILFQALYNFYQNDQNSDQ
jgi:hypothetical protein